MNKALESIRLFEYPELEFEFLEKPAWRKIRTGYTHAEIAQIKIVFNRIDENRDGKIPYGQMSEYMYGLENKITD